MEVNKKIYKTFKIIFLIIIFFLSSCKDRNKIEDKINDSINNFKKGIPEKVFSNFPNYIYGKNTFLSIRNPEVIKFDFNYCGIFITDNLLNSTFNAEYKKIINDSSIIGKVKENQIIIFPTKGNVVYFSESKKDINLKKSLYFIPDYLDKKFSPFNKISSTEEIETVIIDSEFGKYLPEEYLLNNNSLPDEYKHGYSKGIFIYKKTLKMIYWIIIW